MDAAILIEGLVKRYGELAAVDGLDLDVQRGECFGLLGPNGAGKTTTIEILEGLNDPTSGKVEILGRTWDRNPDELRARIGVALQETKLFDRLSVQETLQVFTSFYQAGPSPSRRCCPRCSWKKSARPGSEAVRRPAAAAGRGAGAGRRSGGPVPG